MSNKILQGSMNKSSSPAYFIVSFIIQCKSEKDQHRGKMEDLKIQYFLVLLGTLLTFWPVYASLDRRHNFSYPILFKMHCILSYCFFCSNLLPVTFSAFQVRDSNSLDTTVIQGYVVTSPIREITLHRGVSKNFFFWVTEE